MATVIRLTRRGRMHAPFYRIGVFDSRQRRDGAAIETLGYYNPLARGPEKELELDSERMKYWLSVGARPSDTVRSFFRREDINIEYSPAKARAARNKKRSKKRVTAEKTTGKKHGAVKRKVKATAKAAAN